MALWLPTDHPTLQPLVWINYKQAVWSGSNLSSLANLGSAGGSFGMNGTIVKGAAIGAYNALYINDSNNYLSLSLGAWSAGPLYALGIFRLTSLSVAGLVGGPGTWGGGNTTGLYAHITGGDGAYAFGNGWFANAPYFETDPAHNISAGQWYARGYLLRPTNQQERLNGQVYTTFAGQNAGNTPAYASGTWKFGNIDPGSPGFEGLGGDLAHLFLFNNAPDTDHLERLEAYALWDIGQESQIVSGHTYKSAAPTTGSTYTLTADAGSVAVTGSAAAFLLDRNLLASAGSFALTGGTTNLRYSEEIPALVWSSDINIDNDDVQTTAVVIDGHRKGIYNLVGVMVASGKRTGAPAMRAILDAYGLTDVPIGVKTTLTQADYDFYPTETRDLFGKIGETDADYPDAATLYRQLAVDNPGMYIATGGALTCESAFLDSAADGISGLTGSQLITAQEIKLFCVGGRIGLTANEPNFNDDVTAAYNVCENWPEQIVFGAIPSDVSTIMAAVRVRIDESRAVNPARFAFSRGAVTIPSGFLGSLTLNDPSGDIDGYRNSGDTIVIEEIIDEIQGNLGDSFSRTATGKMVVNTGTLQHTFSVGTAPNRHVCLDTRAITQSAQQTKIQGWLDALVGPSRVNLWKNSTSLYGSSDAGATLTDDVAGGIDGNASASTIAGSGWAGHVISNLRAFAGQTYQYVVHMKKTSGLTRFPAVSIVFKNSTGGTIGDLISEAGGVINTNTGVGYAATGASTPYYGSLACSISVQEAPASLGPNYADYWEVVMSVTAPSGTQFMNFYIQAVSGNNATSYTRDGSGGSGSVNVWGMGLYPESSYGGYLPTTDRAAFSSLTDYTMTADAGACDITGSAANLERGLKVAASAGAVAISGATAGLRAGRRLACDAGAVQATGTDATLAYDHALAAASGSVAVTGSAATLTRTHNALQAESGSVALTGAAAGLTRQLRLSAQAGSVAVSGTAAGLSPARRLAADAGALDVSGSAAALKRTHIMPSSSGSFVVAGADASLVYTPLGSYDIIANAGSYSVTGSDAGLRVSRRLAADAGAVAVTGVSAAVTAHRRLASEAGSVALTGVDASLTYGSETVLAADAGSVGVTGSDASLKVSRQLAAGAGATAVTGADATFLYDRVMALVAGAFSVTGIAATLTVGEVTRNRIPMLRGEGRTEILSSTATTTYTG